MAHARRSHTKSRNGCQDCKRRRVKCDERIPCSSCTRSKLACSLSIAPESPSNSLLSDPTELIHQAATESFTPTDFTLFYHFITSTAGCLNNEPDTSFPWKTSIPSIAPRHPYLLHEVLAVAAIHLHQLHPDNPANYQRIAQDHQARALRQFRAALSSRNADKEAPALFACSALISNYYFAAFDDPALLLFNNDPPGPPEWMLPIRGCAAVVGQFKGPLQASPMGAVMNTYGLTWKNALPPSGGCESDHQIQLLQTRLLALTLGGSQAIYGPALQILRKCFIISEQGTNMSRKIAAMTFPSIVSNEFIEDMTLQKRPAALAIMSFWCVLLNRLDRKYWLRSDSVPQAILGVIKSYLPPEFLELIRWPVHEIGLATNEPME
ncbi:hypothetical protein B0T10DRAFT_502562 [Thelonectria olida]|uniref:Zn(2)-C6 fungal-type domain-containing protein n=1 Tax=Thelonectria olida TaxID=1576542 RepID=A0A9P8VPT3_9HYPO|nr:hypothetical protein B0T10DRAFT_502562 [Thelonectria olida]